MNGFRKFDDLFWKYMLAYKKRTIFTIFGITLAVILFYGAGTVYTSVYQAYYETNSKKYGNYEAAGTVNPEEYQKMKKLDYIEAMLLYQTNTQTIELEDTERWVEVRQMENFENPIFSYDLIDGHYPEQPDELMLDEYQAEYFNVRTGDVLELQGYEYWYGTVRIGDGEQAFRYLQEHTEYDADGMPTEESLQIEDLEKRTIKTRYRIAGIYESDQEYNDFLIESTPFLSLLDQEKEYREMEVCVQFRNHKNHLQQLAKEGIFLEENEWVTEYLKGYNNSVMDPLLQYILFLLAFIVLFWIAFGIIRNAFEMTLEERVRDYGILRCMGTSQYRLQRLLRKEGFTMAAIGCIMGIGITNVMIGIGKHIWGFRQILQALGIDSAFRLKVSWYLVLGSFIFTFCAVLFSLLEPARQFGKMAPVDAVIGKTLIRKERIKQRNGRLIHWLLGIEGEYAYKNVLRKKGTFLASVIGIAISVIGIMIGISIVHIMNASLDDANRLVLMDDGYDASASFMNGIGKGNEDIKKFEDDLLALESVDKVSSCYATQIPSDGETFGLPDGNGKYYTSYFINGFDEEQIKSLEPYLLEGELDRKALEEGGVIVCRNIRFLNVLNGEPVISKEQKTDLKPGDMLFIPEDTDNFIRADGTIDRDKVIACPVVAVVDYNPNPVLSGTPDVIVSRDYYQAHLIPPDAAAAGLYEIRVCCSGSYDPEEIFEFQKAHKNYYFTDGGVHAEKDMVRGYRQLILMIAGLAAGIGAFHIFNTLSFTIGLRKREFQILKAVGMSKRQILKMLSMEGGLAALFGSLLGIGVGFGTGLLLMLLSGEISGKSEYRLPWEGIPISVWMVVLITLVSLLIAKKELKNVEE